MSVSSKRTVRRQFRDACLERDKRTCKLCGENDVDLDIHHITNRNLMPNGGYVLDNGISLCNECHLLAENGDVSSSHLYSLIESSYVKAHVHSQRGI